MKSQENSGLEKKKKKKQHLTVDPFVTILNGSRFYQSNIVFCCSLIAWWGWCPVTDLCKRGVLLLLCMVVE